MNEQIAVVKFGSELLTNERGVYQAALNNYAVQVIEHYRDHDIIVVTSGAVVAGRTRVLEHGSNLELFDDATLAQLGSASITQAWERAFARIDRLAGGLLVTHNEIEDKSEGPQFINKLQTARKLGVISIVNENDALSNRELMKLKECGDNDGLAAHIARKVGASCLDLFTKKGGILSESGVLIKEINESNYAEVTSILQRRIDQRREGHKLGRGGIKTKHAAAWSAAQAGVAARITKPSDIHTNHYATHYVPRLAA